MFLRGLVLGLSCFAIAMGVADVRLGFMRPDALSLIGGCIALMAGIFGLLRVRR